MKKCDICQHYAVCIIRIEVSRAVSIGRKSHILFDDINETVLVTLAENCNQYIEDI